MQLDYYSDLLRNGILPFWLEKGADREHGGVLSSMSERGEVLSEDKYIWSQARFLWVLSAYYNRIERRADLLELAGKTARFLLAHGRDAEGRWLYRVTREGRPVEGAISIFSDCFAVYGLNEYYRASGDRAAFAEAQRTFAQIRERVADPAFVDIAPARMKPGTKAHAVPMILTEVANELGDDSAVAFAEEVLTRFASRDPLLEYLDADYQPLPPPEGALVEPGHAIESMWFVMHVARRFGREDWIRQAAAVMRRHLEAAWDPEYGGLFLLLDARGVTPSEPHWDKKMWWPHTEALYGLLLAQRLTGERWCREWFTRVHEWSLRHFHMLGMGEWRQRLDREGRPVTEVVALPVKDPFHLPRAIILMLALEKETVCD